MSEANEQETKRKIKLTYIISAIAISCLMIGPSMGIMISATTPSIPTVIVPGSMVNPTSYVIFRVDNTWYGKNGTTGNMDFSSTNATKLIQDCIDAADVPSVVSFKPSGPIGTVYVRSAFNSFYELNLTTTIVVKDGISLDGNGIRLAVKHRNDTIFQVRSLVWESYELNSFNMFIRSFTLLGDESNLGTIGFEIDDLSRGVIISDIYTDSVAYPVILFGADFNSQVTQSRLLHGQIGVWLKQNLTVSSGPNACRITDNDISGFDQIGVKVEKATGMKITNNYFETNLVAVHLNWSQPIVSENFLYISSNQRGVVINVSCNPVISGNEFLMMPSSVGIDALDLWSHIVVGSNEFTQYANCISFRSSQESIASITGNHASINGLNSSFFFGKLTRSSVVGNSVYGGVPSINVTGGAWTSYVGNTLANGDKGLRLKSSSQNIIVGNLFRSANIDLYMDSCDNNTIADNFFYATSKIIQVYCTGTDIHSNHGYVTESSGAIAITGGVNTVTVNHGLSATPTVVLVTGNNTLIGNSTVTSISSTQFVISFENQPGSNTWTFYWYANV